MKRSMKKFLSFVLTIALALGMLPIGPFAPTTAMAASDATTIDVSDPAATLASLPGLHPAIYSYAGTTLTVLATAGPITITGTNVTHNLTIQFANGYAGSVTLDNANATQAAQMRLNLGDGGNPSATVNLVLVGTNSIYSHLGSALYISANSVVTISGAGSLTCEGSGNGIAVASGASLTIRSGDITARGNNFFAGISVPTGASLTVNGGSVTAEGGADSAGIGGNTGIGGNAGYSGGTIIINGGTVTATGKESGAGIGGGGYRGSGGTIIINGGTVVATGGTGSIGNGGGAGIGGAGSYGGSASGGSGGTITIGGGTVTATGGGGSPSSQTAYGGAGGGAGIGGGGAGSIGGSSEGGSSGNILLYVPVTATGGAGNNATNTDNGCGGGGAAVGGGGGGGADSSGGSSGGGRGGAVGTINVVADILALSALTPGAGAASSGTGGSGGNGASIGNGGAGGDRSGMGGSGGNGLDGTEYTGPFTLRVPQSNWGGWGSGYFPPKIQKPPVTTPTPFPAQGTAQKRLSAYVLDTLKGKVAFRVNKGDRFTLLGIAENGRALLIQHGELKGYIAIKDFKAEFGAQLKASATAKKAGVYIVQANGKLKRIGYYPLGTRIGINGMDGGYFISSQPGGTYYLKTGEWKLAKQ